MTDEYNTGSNNWWDSSRNRFDTTGSSSSSSSSSSASASSSSSSSGLNGLGSFSWPSEMVDVKVGRSSLDSADTCVGFHDHKLQQPQSGSELHMMNLGLSSQAMDWNQALFRAEKQESSFRSLLQENLSSSTSYHQQQQQQQQERMFNDFSVNDNFNKQINPRSFSLDQHQFSPHSSSTDDSSITSQGLQSIYGSASTMFQGLLGSDNQPQQQQSSLENRSMNNYSYGANYGINSNELVGSWTKVPQFLRNSPPKHTPHSQLHFSNNTPFWNASGSCMNEVRPSFFPSQSQFLVPSFDQKPKNISEVRDSSTVVKKVGSELPTKRPRSETISPVPAIKVRKEKMGDRITALQQLVAPFGKTDTASVLTEAIDCIKFLHGQITVLSTPYMESGTAMNHQQSCTDKSKDGEAQKQDLRSRGLCLVPISSTFPVTHETVDFWTPTFGGTYR